MSAAALLDVLERLLEELHDVLIVERVEHQAAVAARANQAHAAQQAQLVRHGGLAVAEHARRGRSTQQLRARRKASRIRTRVGSPSTLNVSASATADLGVSFAMAELNAYMNRCSYVEYR